MNEQDYHRLKRIVSWEAKSIAEDTSGITVDAEDVEQEMWLHFVAKWSYYEGKDDGMIRHACRKIGRTYCAGERYRFVHHSAQYVYTPDEVRELFQTAFFEPAAWEDVPEKGDYKLTINEGGVTVALWDLREAFKGLRKPDQDIILKRYLYGETLDTAERKRLSRAIDAVTRFLNHKVVAAQESRDEYDDGPGARRVITNAQAIAITE